MCLRALTPSLVEVLEQLGGVNLSSLHLHNSVFLWCHQCSRIFFLTKLLGVQDATHVMVQRAAQLEVDFDQTAAMLCEEMTQRAECQTAVNKFQELYALEQKRCMMTMAALSGTKFQLYVQHQELHQSRDQLSAALVRFLQLLQQDTHGMHAVYGACETH